VASEAARRPPHPALIAAIVSRGRQIDHRGRQRARGTAAAAAQLATNMDLRRRDIAMTATTVFETIAIDQLSRVSGAFGSQLNSAMSRAQELGLRITSTTGGRHAPRSYHYLGRAVDVAGAPSAMRQFYREMAQTNPTELFYDPMGGIKNGRNIGAIGGHGNHVHVAY
jgi:hypothetical protein